jgi:hypothetical protein
MRGWRIPIEKHPDKEHRDKSGQVHGGAMSANPRKSMSDGARMRNTDSVDG